jgi:hypothetical protein
MNLFLTSIEILFLADWTAEPVPVLFVPLVARISVVGIGWQSSDTIGESGFNLTEGRTKKEGRR